MLFEVHGEELLEALADPGDEEHEAMNSTPRRNA
jgi:hypothetical protein